MPRGVYDRSKMRKNKNAKAARVTRLNLNLWDIFPKETRDRIIDHCRRENTTPTDFLKRAVYNALPVHYEVNKQFTFPFGKYAGETAETVKRIDPGYIDWAKRAISGFNVHEELEPVDESRERTPTTPAYPHSVSLSHVEEAIRRDGREMIIRDTKVWGHDHQNNKPWRLFATRRTVAAPWIKNGNW